MDPGGITDEQLDFYHKNGYLVIENWWSRQTVDILLKSIDELVQTFDVNEVSFFSTDEQTRTSDEYFMQSGDKVRAFFEPHAFGKDKDGKTVLLTDKKTAINKLGHDLHTKVPAFKEVSFDSRLGAILRRLGYEHPAVPQSMAILKNAAVGGAVNPHVDGAFLYTRPQTCVGFWWPLEDCTLDNGCLWAVPGSHVEGVKRRFKRTADGTATEFEPPEAEAFDLTGSVPLEIPAGSLVMLHAALVHYSHENKSAKSRNAYSIHVVEAGKGVEYPADNWLQRFDGVPFPRFY